MKELNVVQMEEIEGGQPLACGLTILVGAVGILATGWFGAGVLAAFVANPNGPC